MKDDKKRQWVAWLIVATVITALTIWLGVTYPVPAPPGIEPPVALGTSHFTDIAITEDLSVAGEISLASGAYPLGFGYSGRQLIYATTEVTGTATANHGFTTVTLCVCTLGEDPNAGAGQGAMCTASVSSNVCTLKVWQDDFVTAASVGEPVHWIVVGDP